MSNDPPKAGNSSIAGEALEDRTASVRPIFAKDIDTDLESEQVRPQANRWVYCVLFGVLILLGCYAQWLNRTVYQHNAPFYDSMSYFDRVFEVVSIRQQEGLGPALKNATESPSTICWPYLMAIPFSYFIGPTRAIGVWIEIFYLAVFVLSFAYFLDRYRRMSGKAILVSLVPIFLLSALYRDRAGISDLRVDLPMAFLYGSVACWFLLGCWRDRFSDFLIVGILMGIASLSRAIAPVYLVAGFLPLVIFRLIQVREKKALVVKIVLAIAVTVMIAGWFYYLHHQYLYFYYFQWNTDANANVSYARASRHVLAAAKSIGPFVAVYLLSLYVISRSIPNSLQAQFESGLHTKRNLDSESRIEKPSDQTTANPPVFYWLLWIGVAPLILLIAKRSDVNPFVSLPASIGLILFWMNFQRSRIELLATHRTMRVTYTSCICLILAMSYGYVEHRKGPVPNTAESQQKIIQAMQSDARAEGKKKISFANVVMTDICDASIKSSLQYEMQGKYVSGNQVECDGVTYQSSELFMLPAQVDWDGVQGNTIKEKVAHRFERARSEVDYLICPTMESVPNIQAEFPASLTSKYSSQIIAEALAVDFLKPISEPVLIPSGVKLIVYKVIR